MNDQFGTPHIALMAVGLPIAGLTLLGRIEILAEVASLLHLIMYGMICVTLIALRLRNPYWYSPAYQSPGGLAVPTLGAIASFGLIFLMEPLSITMGFGVMVLALGWYVTFVPEVEFSPPLPTPVKPELISPRILVPVELPNPNPLPTALLETFNKFELLVMGYRIVPEQTSPEQSREEFEEEAEQELDQIVKAAEESGGTVKKDIVFTPDFVQSVDKYVTENNCHSILTATPISSVERLLVPIYTKSQVNRNLATILYDLTRSSHLPVSLVILVSGERESEEQNKIEELKEFAVDQLEQVGLQEDQIRSNQVEVSDIANAVAQLSDENDVVILPEASTTDRDKFFNTLHEDIEEAIECPVLVVLREDEDE